MDEMLVAFLKWAATQEPSKGLSRLINKMWGLFLKESTPSDISALALDPILVKLGLAKRAGKGASATITYKGVK